MKIQIFDPPMCCSTGICGPSVDPELVRFAADLEWVKGQGVEVERQNLSQQPAAFVGVPAVREALQKDGNACLPLTLVDGIIASSGSYPTREALAGFAKIEQPSTVRQSPESVGCCCCCGPSSDEETESGSGCC